MCSPNQAASRSLYADLVDRSELTSEDAQQAGRGRLAQLESHISAPHMKTTLPQNAGKLFMIRVLRPFLEIHDV